MKYTIFGFQQQALAEHSIALDQALFLDWLLDFYPCTKKKIIDGVEYGWLKQSYVAKELPCYFKDKQKVKRVINSLVEKGFVKKQVLIDSTGTYFYIKTTAKTYQLKSPDFENTDDRGVVKIEQGGGSKLNTGGGQNCTHKDPLIRDPLIRDKKKKYIKKDGVLDTLPFSDQNELQGNLSKHSEIKHSFQETKGESPKADKVIPKADKVMVSRDTKRIDDDLGNAGISLEVWEGYREMRKKMKKPLTDRAEQLAIKKAVSLSAKCRCTPDDIIDQSTMNGWLGLFELKTITTTYGVKQNATIRQNTNSTPAERGREANQKYLEELEQRAIQSGYTDEMESEGRSYGC